MTKADYFATVRAILATEGLTSSAKVVWIYLHDKIGDNSHCWPSVATICRDCGLCRATVVAAIRLLESSGYISVSRPERPARHRANEYTIKPVQKPERISTENRSRNQTGSKKNQSGFHTITGLKIRHKPVQKPDSNVSMNDSLNGGSEHRIVFDDETNRFVGIPDSYVADWGEAHPGIDVGRELVRAAIWWRDHPKKRRDDIRGFLSSWMARAEHGFGSANAKTTHAPDPEDVGIDPDVAERLLREAKARRTAACE